MTLFAAPTEAYFQAAFGEPTLAQRLGWPAIARGDSTLILAPTGSGKTLAAFLAALDRLAFNKEGLRPSSHASRAHRPAGLAVGSTPTGGLRPPLSPPEQVRVLYVSPLKALAIDVERNLRAPLAGIVQHAAIAKTVAHPIRVAVRTGDTPAGERARIAKHPPEILITTPESLYLMLTSEARKVFASLETVIVDEIHQLVSNKRGAHLFLSLERLEALRPAGAPPLQRIGLSATQRPLEETARLLAGYDHGAARKVTVVDAGEQKKLRLVVSAPDIDMGRLGDKEDFMPSPSPDAGHHTIWPALHQQIVKLVLDHRSTMVFVNSRRLAERLASALNDEARAAGACGETEEIALAHHGSVAREKRAMIEDRLKRGDLRAIVATSSLELGIDMGAVDLVIQVEAPPSIASGLQRVGRASHQVGGVPEGVMMPKHRADLLACAAAATGMREGDVEETFVLQNPLDVLAQQVVAIVASEGISAGVSGAKPLTASKGAERARAGVSGAEPLTETEACFDLVRRAAPFRDLPRGAFEGVLDMLSGRYPSDEFAELRPRIVWDRLRGTLRGRSSAKRLAIVNGGTIPDRGLYGVFLASGNEKGGKRVGELDEEMVFELREGEVFLLGASSWRADTITSDRVLVTPAAGEPGKMPFWHGDRPSRSPAFGTRIGALTRRIAETRPDEAASFLVKEHQLDASAAKNLVAYVQEQKQKAGAVPTDKTIVLERFIDDVGDLRVCLLSPFGARIHAPWAIAILAKLRATTPGEPDVVWSDDGIAFRITSTTDEPPLDAFFPSAEEVESLVTSSLSQSSLFAARFREAAARALLLPRRAPGRRSPLWAQRKRASDLLAVASRYPAFPIMLEAYRECLRDVFDLPALRDVLHRVETRRIRATQVESTAPSPFASSLLFSFVANFIYDGDAPLAERRAHALSVDHAQLKELLGESELRQLFDEELLASHERLLQRLDSPAHDPDALCDVLRLVGDLSREEIAARVVSGADVDGWLRDLERERRVVRVRVAGEPRVVAVEDAARYRDALGVALPMGLPDVFLALEQDALQRLVARYARTHAPFLLDEVARRYGVAPERVAGPLEALVREGRVVIGAFRPDGHGLEHCDREVLAALRRKALAALRKEVEAVDGASYARFLLAWHGIGETRSGADVLLAAVAQLEGCPIVASTLESEVLPARVPGYKPGDLDALITAGHVVWAGVGALGPRDGRVALYLADHEALLSTPPVAMEGSAHATIRDALEKRGALFFADLARAVGTYAPEIHEALWDMIWSGEVTNDTLEPLRALLAGGRAPSHARPISHPSRGPLAALRGAGGLAPQGRFSLRARRWERTPSLTEHRAALAQAMLERYGVVVRDSAQAENVQAGFGAVYDVFKALEESGRIRRGYFVEGAGGAQFALAEAADRLRLERQNGPRPLEPALWLASTDPANAYGALLPWPASADPEARPQRSAGTHVIVHGGRLVAWAARGSSALLTFLSAIDEPDRGHAADAIAAALGAQVDSGARRALLVETIDRKPAADSELGPAFARAGFFLGARGWMKRRMGRNVLGDDPREAPDHDGVELV